MKLFVQYLKQRSKIICLFLLFSLIHIVVFALYELPVAAAVYPMLLCAVIGVIVMVWDFLRIRKKHNVLKLVRSLSDLVSNELPRCEGILEADYQQIISLLGQEAREQSLLQSSRYQDMIDYYTTWAHQIKTPIAAMRLRLQNEDTSFSRQLHSDLIRIEQYVEMVMMFLRLDSDSTDYVIKEHSLDTIVCQSIRKFAGEFITRKLKLVYDPIPGTVITDDKWLGFVLDQVLSNALKYTPSGTISIYLEEPKTLCIRDTGIGIAPEDLPRVFEKGYTGYNGRADKKASGIGLYLCKRICCNLGHSITAQSTVDVGTIIDIDLAQTKLEVE